jgi:hypothetical protein
MRACLFVFASVILAAFATASSAFAAGVGSARPCSSGTLASTGSYRLALDIGPQEEMYLASEVKARHLKTGEIMLGGEMSMIGTPPAGTRVYHLEVHICNKAGAIVTKLKPAIVVGQAMLPAAIMVGIGAPMSDYHYGNDIALKPSAKITVKVTVKGQVALFQATVPKQ